MDLGLDRARALVTGGSSGLGAAVAMALAAEGTRVAIVARQSDRLTSLAADLDAVAIPADLSTAEGPGMAVESAVAQLGGLDVLLVNSGGPPPGTFESLDDAAWQKAIDGTLWSTLRVIRAALPHLRESERPAICVILSSSVREPLAALTTSNLLRPGLAGLIKSLTSEIAPIRINGIAPGRVSTGRIKTLDEGRARSASISVEEVQQQTIVRIPMGRYGDPLEVGRVAAFLLS
ncbi:MAG TPA: SDR family NAD(P)-dependent oxidoreductase, partial [Aeromicrobium sp.]|nr:SDR family NAD(P)-dependent oxidoreductase [Aeromicrobium sp.]